MDEICTLWVCPLIRLSDGTVFKMTPSGTFTVLHAFADGTGGTKPRGALIQATDGNFYGTTSVTRDTPERYGGTVFKMTPSGTVTVVHAFNRWTYGAQPFASLAVVSRASQTSMR